MRSLSSQGARVIDKQPRTPLAGYPRSIFLHQLDMTPHQYVAGLELGLHKLKTKLVLKARIPGERSEMS
jgi:hypothetical protein